MRTPPFPTGSVTAAPSASGASGQALVEFAIVFPLQLFLTLGLIQFCLVFTGILLADHAAFRAARVALVRPEEERAEPMRRAAALVLSPLAGVHDAAAPREDFVVPGWGEIPGSGRAYDKIRTRAVRDTSEGANDIVAVLEFDFEFVIPVVDALAAMICSPLPEAEEAIRAFGWTEGGFSVPAGEATPYFDAIRAQEGTGGDARVGLVRIIDGAPHLVLVRTARLHMGPYETD